jgi:hypothetical protein
VLAVSLVFARLVVEPNSPMPQLADDAVMLVKRQDVSVGCPTDGGMPDGGVAGDAGTDDAGVPGDAGMPPMCETIEGDAISLVVRPRFTTDMTGARFAVLYVTPSRPIVETVADQFVELATITAPKTEFREIEVPDYSQGTRCATNSGGGCGGGGDYSDDSGGGCGGGFYPAPIGDSGLGDGQVGVEHVGPYDIVRAQPADAAALAALLDSFGYLHTQADLDAVAPYLARGYTVVAVRVAIEPGTSMPAGRAMTPISMTWSGSELRLPVALGTDTQDIKVFIAADGRYDFPGADVPYAQYSFSKATSYLTLNKLTALTGGSPDDDPVAARVTGDPEYHETNVVTTEVLVPVNDCSGGEQEEIGCCRQCNAKRGVPDRLGRGRRVVVLGSVVASADADSHFSR